MSGKRVYQELSEGPGCTGRGRGGLGPSSAIERGALSPREVFSKGKIGRSLSKRERPVKHPELFGVADGGLCWVGSTKTI
jgi:hypothetical protein